MVGLPPRREANPIRHHEGPRRIRGAQPQYSSLIRVDCEGNICRPRVFQTFY
jgi:hypothetical protein